VPPSAQGSSKQKDGNGQDTLTGGGDFVEESLKRKRIKLEKEKEDRELRERKEKEAEEKKKAEELRRRKANLSLIGEDDDAQMGENGQENEEEVMPPSTSTKNRTKPTSSSAVKPTSSAAAMPPPASIFKKRALSPSSTQAAHYLQAPKKRKKKGAELDPLDIEFNKLKLAKKAVGGKKNGIDGEEGQAGEGGNVRMGEGDGVTCKMVVVQMPLFRKPREQKRDEVDGSVPNFKKFKKVRHLCFPRDVSSFSLEL
jgi:hypothetical protein